MQYPWEPSFWPQIHKILIMPWLAIASPNLAAITYAVTSRHACLSIGTYVYNLGFIIFIYCGRNRSTWKLTDLTWAIQTTTESWFAFEHLTIWTEAKCTVLPGGLSAELYCVPEGQRICCDPCLNSPGTFRKWAKVSLFFKLPSAFPLPRSCTSHQAWIESWTNITTQLRFHSL